jgi:hypothetical protein
LIQTELLLHSRTYTPNFITGNRFPSELPKARDLELKLIGLRHGQIESRFGKEQSRACSIIVSQLSPRKLVEIRRQCEIGLTIGGDNLRLALCYAISETEAGASRISSVVMAMAAFRLR